MTRFTACDRELGGRDLGDGGEIMRSVNIFDCSLVGRRSGNLKVDQECKSFKRRRTTYITMEQTRYLKGAPDIGAFPPVFVDCGV